MNLHLKANIDVNYIIHQKNKNFLDYFDNNILKKTKYLMILRKISKNMINSLAKFRKAV